MYTLMASLVSFLHKTIGSYNGGGGGGGGVYGTLNFQLLATGDCRMFATEK